MKKRSEINYLSFEGGGGKGNAYLGAIYALEEAKVISFQNSKLTGSIKGISGASAGAITAFLLGSGFSGDEIFILLSKDFNYFFDYPIMGENVIAGFGFSEINIDDGKARFKNAPKWVVMLLIGLHKTGVIGSQIDNHLAKESPELAKKIKDKLPQYLSCLIADWGLFSGRTIQEEFFEFWLQYKIFCVRNKIAFSKEGMNEDAYAYAKELLLTQQLNEKPCTFKEHYAIFGVELAFTSVNFKTENVEVFSYKTTPDFPISTAVRMSMSLPLIFKPVLITTASVYKLSLPPHFEGYWVDGGLFDNAPARVFNDVYHTILFRLGNRKEKNVLSNLIDFLRTYLKIGIMGTGSGQVNSSTVPDLAVVELNVSGLSLLKFNLEKTDLTNLSDANKKITLDFLNNLQP
ncbi:patatin-like phospholipase family protein [Pedobacter nototheniae]|uniref:patatin-like phospholipase family protein n=1 Tax=Pedobacter nototheniae TaxID=2488994 RepID=UPI0029301792|nr:patatin-like phospholipase family protein [Pedobacter nototheniae]